jgi:hypothetical protein
MQVQKLNLLNFNYYLLLPEVAALQQVTEQYLAVSDPIMT